MARTITIHLADGNPNGIKLVDLSNRPIRAFLIPRAKLKESRTYAELRQPAIYFLCERNGDQLYVGECESFSSRVRDHDQRKDFWEIAIIFITKDNSLEKGDVKFLESVAVERAKGAARFTVVNGAVPKRNTIHQFKLDAIEEFYEDLRLLVSALGYPFFDKVSAEAASADQIWYCTSSKTNAKAVYNEHGFTVLAGSIIDSKERPSFVERFPYALKERRDLLKNKAQFDELSQTYSLKENITFGSANKAAGFCVGGHVNAWITWKNVNGRTMDEVIRK